MKQPLLNGSRILSGLAPVIGLIFILAYWWSVHPIGFSMGYTEDFCPDILRQLMAENLTQFGKPTFHTNAFMTPTGAPVPYMSWSIERDWMGAYFWKWNPNFPFMWVYFGASLVLTYFGVGLILRKMNLSRQVAWSIATAAVLFHIPRHFKIWHHIRAPSSTSGYICHYFWMLGFGKGFGEIGLGQFNSKPGEGYSGFVFFSPQVTFGERWSLNGSL